MKIQKRNGSFENLSFNKINTRLSKLQKDKSLGVLDTIDIDLVAQKVVSTIYDGVSSIELDEEAARICINMTDNLEFSKLASRIIISNMHKNTDECFSSVMETIQENTGVLSEKFILFVKEHRERLDKEIIYLRDYSFDYFGFKTLEKSYLMKIKGKVVERPQHLYMRVAVNVHYDIEEVIKTYHLISQHFFTFASPTMFNSGTNLQNLSSCFHEDTVVTTVNRGPIKIKDVVIGDSVISHLGNVKKVIQTHKNLLNDRKFFELDIYKTAPIKVTGNHKLWVLRKQYDKNISNNCKPNCYDINYVKKYFEKNNCKLLSESYTNMKTKLDYICHCNNFGKTNFDCFKNKNTRCGSNVCKNAKTRNTLSLLTYIKPEWISVNDLQPGDFISIPNKKEKLNKVNEVIDISTIIYINPLLYKLQINNNKLTLFTNKYNKKHNTINRYLEIDNNFATFVGIFYGDGHIMTSNDGVNIRGIGITIHKDNKSLIYFCKNYGEKTFGINSIIHNVKNQNVTQVLFNSYLIGCLFKDLFGIKFNGKKIWTKIFSWDKNLVLSLLQGIITTDGCISKTKSVTIQMSNVKFMRELYYLLRNNGIDASYGKEKIKKNSTCEHVQISIPFDYYINNENINKLYTDDRLTLTSIDINNVNKAFKTNYNQTCITYNDFKFLKYMGKKEITENLPEYVYTLGIEDDHSYNVEGIIAQNCFLMGMDDSISGIFKCISDCALISKVGGGIGIHIHDVRSKGSVIKGTNGTSDGIIPMLKVMNSTSVFVNQSGKRKGSFAIYLGPEHPDIFQFLELRKNQGSEEMRARDLFLAMWIPDYFMEKVEKDEDWYLLDPNECTGLQEVYGKDYVQLYESYVQRGMYKKKVKAQEIWLKILESQIETGTPYILYKDAINKKSNQKNIGVIKSSNLCVAPETMILTSKGYFRIQDLENQEVQVWNGEKFTSTIVQKTGENQELLTIKVSNGTQIECTYYHKFYNDKLEIIQAKDLQPNTKLIKSKFPVITEGLSNFPYPYHYGLFVKQMGTNLPENIILKVPLTYNLDIKLRWLEGLVDCMDIQTSFSEIIIQIDNNSFLVHILYLLQTLGCNPVISDNKLIINAFDTAELCNLGFKPKKYILKLDNQILEDSQYIYVTEVVQKNRISDTYCFKEEERGMGTFNGILTGQCAEITLYSDTDQYAVCFTGDTKILTKKGYKRIDQCHDSDILSYFNNDIDLQKNEQFIKSKLIYNGIKEIYQLNCYGKKPIKVTKNHLFAVFENDNIVWKTFEDLNIGDKIFTPSTQVLPGYNIDIQKEYISNVGFITTNSSPVQIASALSDLFSLYSTIRYNKIYNKWVLCFPSIPQYSLYFIQNLLQCFGINSKVMFDILNIEDTISIQNFLKHINFMLPNVIETKIKKQVINLNLQTEIINNSYSVVKSKQFIGTDKVYDLNVPNSHNFIAHGMVVHNCNLASIALPKYVTIHPKTKVPKFDHSKLLEIAKSIVLPMNNVIDFNYYPTPETEKSNMLHRPIGIGVQGLSDTFIKMRYPFESEEAKKLNKEIFETIYYGLLWASNELAKKDGAYSSFNNSPASFGKLQFDLWKDYTGINLDEYLSDRYNWDELKENIKKYGLRNSTLTTCMPTASSAQIMGNTESFEPFDSCIFKRRVLSGEYIVINKYLIEDLTKLKLWNKDLKDQIIAHNGSIQDIEEIPEDIKNLYKTVWEISMKNFIDQSADRGPFVDMTQSLNLFMESPNVKKLTNMHFYGWKKGLKTGIYYLRSKAGSTASKFTIDPLLEKKGKKKKTAAQIACSIQNKEDCLMCSA